MSEVEEKLDFKVMAPILVIVIVDLMGFTILIPLLPLYAAIFGANELLIGILAATYPLMQFVGAPFLGQLSDRFGRRPILLISQVGTFIGFLVLGFAGSLWMLFLSRFIDGISGANIVVAQAAITDRTTAKTRTQGLGLIGAAFGVGFVIGPIIAFVTLALSNDNYTLVAFIAAGFSLFSILLTWFWLEESLPPEKRGTTTTRKQVGFRMMLAAVRRPDIGFLLLLMFIQQFAFNGFEQFFAVFTLGRLGLDGSGNAALFVVVGIILVGVQGGLIGRWSRRFGDRWLILMGLVVLGVGLILSAVTPRQPVPWYNQAAVVESLSQEQVGETTADLRIDLPDDQNKGWLGIGWLLLALVPTAVGAGVLQPSINSMMTQRANQESVGNILGISTSFTSLSHVLAPLIFGAIFQWLGSIAPFMISGIILLLLWVVARTRIDS